jgi:hypothetical protein
MYPGAKHVDLLYASYSQVACLTYKHSVVLLLPQQQLLTDTSALLDHAVQDTGKTQAVD